MIQSNHKRNENRSNYSTNHALLSITERIRELIDTGQYVCGVFVDLEKAFDTVNHKILCSKLDYYGIRGNVNNLIQSYLCNRKQYVSLNGCAARFLFRTIIILNLY